MIEFLGQKAERMHTRRRKGRAQSAGLPPLQRRVNRRVNNGSREMGKEESSLQLPQTKQNKKPLEMKYGTAKNLF